ncbi:olfactory receptor 1F1-like [Microcaecilia unicolor]|uniref:Olfactory receptor n=1 Tax=Microcaecilia unicolor TaxID=1415580 RepID=A0A6P7XBC9_9AMPH|nr:olfactory receptor 1F1-like [Microcaecilia unicolor]
MAPGNQSGSSEFLLLGFSGFRHQQMALFMFFLALYTVAVVGNLSIMTTIWLDPRLHSPMYFFLGNLSLIDICFTSVTMPKLLLTLLTGDASISFIGCFCQMYFFVFLGVTEMFLLAAMAYDRYVAICDPLRYAALVSHKLCAALVASSWSAAALHSLLHIVIISHLSYCGRRRIHHFFCDMTALLKLSCSDTSTSELVIFTEGSLVIMSPFLFILSSYVVILSVILKIHSAEGRKKAFSTCSSHLTVVTLFYGTVIFIYFRPSSSYSDSYDRIVSVIYSVVTPMLNPFIYSLRNTEVKGALRKAASRIVGWQFVPAHPLMGPSGKWTMEEEEGEKLENGGGESKDMPDSKWH